MKKISICLFLAIIIFEINSSIKIIDYDSTLKIPDSEIVRRLCIAKLYGT